MFDTFVNDRRTYVDARGPSHITVTEKRAPTDESVRILREMEEAARKNVIGVYEVKTNVFDGKVLLIDRAFDHARSAILIFDLNGTRFEIESTCDLFELSRDKDALWKKLHKDASERIAAEILIPALTKADIR